MAAEPAESTEKSYFFHTYHRLPVEIVRGDGPYLFSKDGTRYLDMFSGIAVNALGHNHPGILRAIADQAGRYLHLSNYFLQDPQLDLARMLVEGTGFRRVFLTNSGTEATEGAIKIARQFRSGRGKTEIFGFSNSFHGRTLGALSLMDRTRHRAGFEPFVPHCSVLPFNDSAALETAVNGTTLALFLEFLQGEGGIRPASKRFVDTIVRLREKHGFLLIADEVQSGLGRTGKFFAYEHYGVRPDMVLLAKALGGGLPLGAILGNDRVGDLLHPGTHGSTFGGNPVACAAGTVVMHEVMKKDFLAHVHQTGESLRRELNALQREFPGTIREVRGMGLMLGVELYDEAGPFVEGMRRLRVLVNATERNILRILPALIIGEEQIEEFIAAFRETIQSDRITATEGGKEAGIGSG